MLLTDPAVQYWSCVIAVLATVAVLMLWNRVRGPKAVKGLSRLGLLLGGYLATAAAVLISVNIAYGGLVVSLDDLFADINPPMGQYMHHHRACGGGVDSQSAAPDAPAVASAVAPAADEAQPPDDGQAADGQAVDGREAAVGPPCPQFTGTAGSAGAAGAQAATR